jgi:hypothetical protein
LIAWNHSIERSLTSFRSSSTTTEAQSPCLREFRLDLSFPAAVRGPVDFNAFLRFAAILARLTIMTNGPWAGGKMCPILADLLREILLSRIPGLIPRRGPEIDMARHDD